MLKAVLFDQCRKDGEAIERGLVGSCPVAAQVVVDRHGTDIAYLCQLHRGHAGVAPRMAEKNNGIVFFPGVVLVSDVVDVLDVVAVFHASGSCGVAPTTLPSSS